MAVHQQTRCLYEILGVTRDSTQDEIRSSYRRLALQLHPDKLAQSGASAGPDSTAAFQELLHAYEVLSDPKERSWYDSHRSQILFSDPVSKSKSRFSSLNINLFSFFSTSVYSDYSDSGKGFYKVYGDVFSKIYSNELHFAEKLGFPSDDIIAPAPLIGNLDSPYSQVTAFYSYWLGYSTVMDFSWVDEYDSFAGPNRKARRLMEEENKKARKKAKREHNDTVRGLAAFVKRRDKRVLDMQMKKKKEEEKRIADEKERKKEEERRRKEKAAMMYREPECAENDEENGIIWDEDEEDNGKKKKGEVEFYCVACNKKFKSEKQWKNHEQSKKHREKIVELRSTFDEEEFALKDIAQEGLCEPHVVDNESSEISSSDQLSESFRDDFKLQEEGVDIGNENVDDLLSNAEVTGPGDNNVIENNDELLSNAEVTGPGDDNVIENNDECHDVKIHGIRKSRRAKKGTGRETEARDASGAMRGSQKNDNGVHEDNGEGHFEEFAEENSENSKGDQVDRSQKIKKQQLDEKGHTKKDTVPQKSSSKGKKQKGATKAHTNLCGTCGESFDSRNKLFAHLGNTGHAMLKS